MNITVISVGKKHSTELVDAIAVYEKRLSGKYQLDWRLIAPSSGTQQQQVDDESQKVLSAIKPKDYVILLDEAGESLTNQQFAKVFDTALSAGNVSRIVFVIGGAYGVSDELKSQSSLVWSLSKLVFPHQLVRLILTEQLYRTTTLLDNHPYHHQ